MANLSIGPEILNDFTLASSREWLVTNGIGGYASGSLSGANTRRYHGLLVAALTPPTGRMTLLSHVEESVTLAEATCELASNQYPGAIYPRGHEILERFDNFRAPTFVYRPFPETRLEKRIWMEHGRNTTYIRYCLTEASEPVILDLSPLICWKQYHSEMHPWPGFPLEFSCMTDDAVIRCTDDAPRFRVVVSGAHWEAAGYWHNNIEHERERERGFDFHEDLYCPGRFRVTLRPGEAVTLVATIEQEFTEPDAAWNAFVSRQERLLERADVCDDFARALVLTADAFVVDGVLGDGCSGFKAEPPGQSAKSTSRAHHVRSTIIAGYHWFADWGRDTMISLPGLCLATGRAEVAHDILTSFSAYVSQGMLPNRFPDSGSEPEYNTVDATLWYFQAISETAGVVGTGLVRELWPTLVDIVDWHLRGTRYGIVVDNEDGLLRAGVPGVQLTWMDAKVGDCVITPRIGKPVEINALWYNALRIMERFAEELGEDSAIYSSLADKAAAGFRRAFVRPDGKGLYDVLGPEQPDTSIRPNQIFAVSLPNSPLTVPQQKRVLATVEDALLTPVGLRTLAPSDPAYRPTYSGGPAERDSAYHQGTVWPWLLGAFVSAHYRVYRDSDRALSYLQSMRSHLLEAGIGSISEIVDAQHPHAPNGCIAQAWSVAEILRSWVQCGMTKQRHVNPEALVSLLAANSSTTACIKKDVCRGSEFPSLRGVV